MSSTASKQGPAPTAAAANKGAAAVSSPAALALSAEGGRFREFSPALMQFTWSDLNFASPDTVIELMCQSVAPDKDHVPPATVLLAEIFLNKHAVRSGRLPRWVEEDGGGGH